VEFASSLGEFTVEDESEEKYPERLPNSFWIVRGANRLRRRPLLSCCSKRFASSRPWRASASRGESAGGTSPARGLGKSARERLLILALALARLPRPPLGFPGGSKDCERKSRKPGRCDLLFLSMVKVKVKVKAEA
jgi:hypothetical protein